MTNLAAKVQAFKAAEHAFRTCPAMLLSSGITDPKDQAISDTFFGLREELTELGLALDSRKTTWVPLEKALFRWAVWQQAAGYTARLTLNHQYKPPVVNQEFGEHDLFEHDGAVIMEMFARAEQDLFELVA